MKEITNTTEIQKIHNIMNSYMPTNWTTTKNKFLEIYSLPKLSQETNNLNRPIIKSEKILNLKILCKQKSRTRQLH